MRNGSSVGPSRPLDTSQQSDQLRSQPARLTTDDRPSSGRVNVNVSSVPTGSANSPEWTAWGFNPDGAGTGGTNPAW